MDIDYRRCERVGLATVQNRRGNENALVCAVSGNQGGGRQTRRQAYRIRTPDADSHTPTRREPVAYPAVVPRREKVRVKWARHVMIGEEIYASGRVLIHDHTNFPAARTREYALRRRVIVEFVAGPCIGTG